MENFQMRDVMQGISNIQNTLANLLLRIDGHVQGRQLDAVTNEISGKHGIEERLENVQHQANDTMYIINDLQEKQKKTESQINGRQYYNKRSRGIENRDGQTRKSCQDDKSRVQLGDEYSCRNS